MDYLSIIAKNDLPKFTQYLQYSSVYSIGFGILPRDDDDHRLVKSFSITGAYTMLIYSKQQEKHSALQNYFYDTSTKNKNWKVITTKGANEEKINNTTSFYEIEDTDIIYKRNDAINQILKTIQKQVYIKKTIIEYNYNYGEKGDAPITYVLYNDLFIPEQFIYSANYPDEVKHILTRKKECIQQLYTSHELNFEEFDTCFDYILVDNTWNTEFLWKLYSRFNKYIYYDDIITISEKHFIELVQSLEKKEYIVISTKPNTKLQILHIGQ